MEYGGYLELSKKKPIVTIYQNESDVIMVYSPIIDDKKLNYRASSSSFENSWSDGASCGFTIGDKKDLKKFIKENNLVKRGLITLGLYCWSEHTLKDGATLTCELKPNHKRKHQAFHKNGKRQRIVKWGD